MSRYAKCKELFRNGISIGTYRRKEELATLDRDVVVSTGQEVVYEFGDEAGLHGSKVYWSLHIETAYRRGYHQGYNRAALDIVCGHAIAAVQGYVRKLRMWRSLAHEGVRSPPVLDATKGEDMGQVMTYELGELNIGRWVKVKPESGGDQHGVPGVLKEAHKDYAVISGAGNRLSRAKWSCVRDWTSHNEMPLVVPQAVVVARKKDVPPPEIVAPAGSPFEVFSSLSQAVPEAVMAIQDAEEEVDTALEMVQQAKARHAAAVAKLTTLRTLVNDAAQLMDHHLVGTNGKR